MILRNGKFSGKFSVRENFLWKIFHLTSLAQHGHDSVTTTSSVRPEYEADTCDISTRSLSRIVSVTNTYHIYSKVKLSLYRHGGAQWSYSFLTSALDGGERSVSRPKNDQKL